MPEPECPPWWERWAGWWEQQQLYLEAEDPQGRFVYEPESHRAAWQGRLVAAGRTWPLIIRWGPGTPYMAPAIEPVNCWSVMHQLRDRSMCLLRPESLASGYAGVPDMGFWLKRAVDWFEGYVREGWAIHPTLWPFVALGRPEAGYRVNMNPMRLMGLPPAWRSESLARVGLFRALVPRNEGLSVVAEWRPGVKGRWRPWDEAASLVDAEHEVFQGVWVRPEARLDPRLEDVRRLRFFEDARLQKDFEHLLRQASGKSQRKGCGCLLAVGVASTREDEPLWLIDTLESTAEPPPVLAPPDPNASDAELRGFLTRLLQSTARQMREILDTFIPWSGIVLDTRTLDARRRTGRPDELHRRIASAQVLLVGLGALGSEVAHLLAQEGVGQFVLVDGDLLLPGNVARHRANLTDAGRPKVRAVEQDIRRINPSASVEVLDRWIDEQLPKLGWTPSEPDQAFVAVGLTGDEASEHVLGEFASFHGQHCIHAWMEMDGQVLRLFRVLNGEDPTLLELGREPTSFIPPLPRSSSLAVRPRECAEAVLPGSAGNIHAAANFTARMVLDVISGRREEDNHWLFAPDGLRDPAEDVPPPLRSRYGVASFRLKAVR